MSTPAIVFPEVADAASATRADVEDFLYAEAALLDAWRLDEWLALLAPDVTYRIPSNDSPGSDPASALFTIADDARRVAERVKRLKDRNAHAEFPRSRTRRLVTNVRITGRRATELDVEAAFVVYRFRRAGDIREYVGGYRYVLRVENGRFVIAARTAVLDAQELGALGVVSFLL